MTKLRWTEILFIICFLLIAVGGTWLWPSESFSEALIVLVVATVIAAGVWLAVVLAITRRRE